MTRTFINGAGVISPQHTLPGEPFLEPVVESTAEYLKCIEPVYRSYIDPIASRRMSRLIKMGIASARMAVKDQVPDAIITGTGLGSVEDTEKILAELTVEEKFLNPTPFIQSTYNTISSQIAISLKCNGYNSTYVHRTNSFESALLDAMLQIRDGSASRVLAGGIDEMTPNHLSITRRIGLWKEGVTNNLALLNDSRPGSLAGEGSAFFLLGNEQSDETLAELLGVTFGYHPRKTFDKAVWVKDFLALQGLAPEDVDLVVAGLNGDPAYDPGFRAWADQVFPGRPVAWYKHLCGEYHTASAFGMYLAAKVLQEQSLPGVLLCSGNPPARLRRILLMNHYRDTDHSLILTGRD